MKAKKFLVKIFFMILCFLTFEDKAFSQPYIFYYVDDPNYTGGGYSVDIYRQNLGNGISELILKDAGRVDEIFDSPDQNKLILQNRNQVEIVELNNSNKRTILLKGAELDQPERDEVVHPVIFTPATNRFYVSIASSEDGHGKTIVFDNTSFQPIDTLTEELYSYFPICISTDQNRAYRFIPGFNGLVFRTFDIFANKRLPDKKLTSLGSFAYVPDIDDAKSGFALVKYERIAEHGFGNQQYVVCNVDQGLVYIPFAFPWRSEGYLSSDGKYAIIEQVNFDTTRESAEYHTGIVYVFDASTGQLKQRLALPPNGRILVFDNYPQTFYYYNDSTNQAVAVSDTVVTPTNVLIDTLISLKHQAVANGWLTNGPEHEKDEDDDKADEGIVERLDRRLDKAKAALVKADSVKARQELQLFDREVEDIYHQNKEEGERRGVPVLTSEGYALLKYNAEYLIERLPGRHGRRDNEKGNVER